MALLPDYCYNGEDIWLTVSECHYSNRALQFGMQQTMPPICYTDCDLHQIDLRGKHDQDWQRIHANHLSHWRACRNHYVEGDIVDGLVVSDDSLPWYDSITR